MAAQLPGRTDNEIKNYWNTRVKRRQRAGLPLYPQDIQKQAAAYHLNQINQPRSFQSAPPQASVQHPSSQQQQQPSKHNFGSPLPLLDPVNFPVTAPLLGHHPAPYLPPPFHRYKRFRDNNCIGFSLPFSANPPQQQNQPPPLYSQGLNTQLLPASSFQLSSSNFDFNPPPPILGITPFDSDNSSPFSMKLELPSDQQLSQPADAAAALGSINDFKMISPLGRGSSSGLLDALFQESQAIVEVEDSRRDELLEEKCGLDGVSVSKAPPSGSIFDNNTTPPPLASASQWDDSSSAHSSPALQIKKEGNDGMNSLEDLSFLDFMPTVRVPELYSDSGEMSNGQSSGVTDDEIRLDWPNWNNITSTC